MACGDIVDVGINGFGVGVVPLHRHFKFDRAIITLTDLENRSVWEKEALYFHLNRKQKNEAALIAKIDIFFFGIASHRGKKY